MQKLVLYGHGGSNNHGCEAIVRSTIEILNRQTFKKYGFILSTIQYDADKEFQVPVDEYIINEYEFKPRICKRIINKILAKAFNYNDYLLKINYRGLLKFIKGNKDDCLYVSVGGDNYCCTNPHWLYILNDAIDNDKSKRILWGCSVEPESIDERMAKDLKGYKLIVTRESISYEALINRGVSQNTVLYPDPAFTLNGEFPNALSSDFYKNVVGINISPVVKSLGADGNIVVQSYITLISYILENTEYNILLVPHVNIEGNSDYKLQKTIFSKVKNERVLLIGDTHNANELKGIISKCRMFVGARTHASIAAYSTCVPTLVIGYSVKAKGIATDIFGTYENYVLPVQSLQHVDDLTNAFMWLSEHEDNIRTHLQNFIPGYIEKAWQAGKEVSKLLEMN